MISGMKGFAAISPLWALLLSGCSLLEPRSTFEISSFDRPVMSASLKLCQHTFPLIDNAGRWQATINVPGDCHGGVSAVMSDGKHIFCSVGYVTVGDGSIWHFAIEGDGCRSDVTYGDNGSGNGS